MELSVDGAHCGRGRFQHVGADGKVMGKAAIGACQKFNVPPRVVFGGEKKGGPRNRVFFPEHHPLKSRCFGSNGSRIGEGVAGKRKKKEEPRKPTAQKISGGREE